MELTTVTEDEAVFFDGTRVLRIGDLSPGSAHRAHGVDFRTLDRPGGRRLATVATVNDVHFGEDGAGRVEGSDIGPVMVSAPGQAPYPEVMNAAAVAEIAALAPDAVVAKGDLTARGTPAEHAAFEACYRPAFGDRLWTVRGNHDNQAPQPAFTCPPVRRVDVPGAVLAIIDTSRYGRIGGRLDAGQLEWLDDVAADAGRERTPVLVMAHHPCWQAGTERDWVGSEPALDAASSEAVVAVVARRPAIVAYLAGHTHRNKVRHFASTGPTPFVEVACVKDFPGTWAEYRIFEGGILQVHRRLSSPEALAWSEGCRAMVFGLYPRYAFGALTDRCLVFPPRWGQTCGQRGDR